MRLPLPSHPSTRGRRAKYLRPIPHINWYLPNTVGSHYSKNAQSRAEQSSHLLDLVISCPASSRRSRIFDCCRPVVSFLSRRPILHDDHRSRLLSHSFVLGGPLCVLSDPCLHTYVHLPSVHVLRPVSSAKEGHACVNSTQGQLQNGRAGMSHCVYSTLAVHFPFFDLLLILSAPARLHFA